MDCTVEFHHVFRSDLGSAPRCSVPRTLSFWVIALGSPGPVVLYSPPGIMSLSKPSQEVDPVKGTKMAKRFNEAMALALNPEPVLVDPRCCGVSLVNRLFSVMQIHKVILPSVIKEGHDPHRPVPGILCEVTEPEALKAFVEHNVKLSKSPLMPPLDPSLLRYEILGGTHYNTSLRLGKACSKSPAGDLSKLMEEDESWAKACREGHRWIILPSTLDQSLKADICAWRNQDQNENQAITDGEIVRLCKLAVDDFLAGVPGGKQAEMPLAQLVASACNRTPLRINPTVVGGYCRFVCLMAQEGAMPMVDEFLEFGSGNVDPSALSLPHVFLDNLSKNKTMVKKPQTRLAMAIAMYTEEGAQSRTPPSPNVCGLISSGDLGNLEKTPFVPEIMEKTLDRLQTEWRPILEKHAGQGDWDVMTLVRSLQVLVVRAALGEKT